MNTTTQEMKNWDTYLFPQAKGKIHVPRTKGTEGAKNLNHLRIPQSKSWSKTRRKAVATTNKAQCLFAQWRTILASNRGFAEGIGDLCVEFTNKFNHWSHQEMKKMSNNPNKSNRPSGSRYDMIRCRTCGKTAARSRVRIGDCHTDRYGKGDFGQTYSGAKGRGRLYWRRSK